MAEMSELEQLVSDIRKNVKQKSINKVDEVKVMKAMLNDKNFTIGVYEKSNGYVGQKSPHDEAVRFVRGIVAGATGLDNRDAQVLAEHYEFTNKDAGFLVNNMKDFLYVYTGTGRKINLIQSVDCEASVFIREIPEGTKVVPNNDTGESKTIKTTSFTKLISSSKNPKYNVD